MRCIILFNYTLALCLCFNLCLSQDRIYLAAGPKEGKVTEMTPDKIKYKNPQNPGPVYTIPKDKVIFLFNNAGNYYVLNNAGQEDRSSQFLQATTVPATDVIFTMDGSSINCSIEKEDNSVVHYSYKDKKGSIEKGSVAAIIYKTGQHKIISTDLTKVAGVLLKNQDAQMAGGKAISSRDNPVVQGKLPAKEAPSPAQPENAITPASTQTENTPAKPKVQASNAAVRDTIASVRNKNREIISEELGIEYSEYEKKALQKTRELSDFLKVLCDKNTEYEKAEKAIDQACLLFVNEDAVVEVSSVNRQNIMRYKIRDYLKKLKLVKYGKVEIEWANIQYVSKLKMGPDGNYFGVITFEQTFRGYMDNELVYSDVTRKNIEVVLKSYKKSIEGRTKTSWDILLSDIGVIETKRPT